jgi:hypothetical protein
MLENRDFRVLFCQKSDEIDEQVLATSLKTNALKDERARLRNAISASERSFSY